MRSNGLDVTRAFNAIIAAVLISLPLAGCQRPSSSGIQGYIEGRYTYIATSVSGQIRELFVDRGSEVKAGTMLFVLEEQPEKDVQDTAAADLKQAEANRDVILANLYYTKTTYKRNKVLAPQAVSQQTLDLSTSDYNANLAQLLQAESNISARTSSLARATWEVEQKFVAAPVNGIVFQKYYRLGEYSEAGKPILSILAPEDIKAIFYVPEPELASIQLNDEIAVRCDECKKSYVGHVSFISPRAEYTPPIIFSDQTNAKLIYRIEARFSAEDAVKMHPGQPVKVVLKKHV